MLPYILMWLLAGLTSWAIVVRDSGHIRSGEDFVMFPVAVALGPIALVLSAFAER